jgi:hypothetical protein
MSAATVKTGDSVSAAKVESTPNLPRTRTPAPKPIWRMVLVSPAAIPARFGGCQGDGRPGNIRVHIARRETHTEPEVMPGMRRRNPSRRRAPTRPRQRDPQTFGAWLYNFAAFLRPGHVVDGVSGCVTVIVAARTVAVSGYPGSVSGVPGGVVHELPVDLRKALIANSTALAAWQDITPLARNEFICWVEDAKQEVTRKRRISRAQEALEEGKRRPCCWPGCRHRERAGR